MTPNRRGKRLSKFWRPALDQIGVTDATPKLGALLLATMRPTGTGEPWIDAEDVARRTSQQRRRRCSVQEVTAAIRGDSIPAPDIVHAALELRAEQRRADADSDALRSRHAGNAKLLLQTLLDQESSGKTKPHRMKILANVFRRKTAWALGIVMATVLTLVTTGIIPNILGQFFNSSAIEDKLRPGPAILISESLVYPEGPDVPVVTVMPGNYRPSSALIRAMSRPLGGGTPTLLQQEHTEGVQVGIILIRLILEGNRNELIRILNIQPVHLQRKAPIGGVLFDMYPQGEDDDIQIGLNLDKLAPQAMAMAMANDGNISDKFYFLSHTISLSKGEQAVVVIQAASACYDARFNLAVNYSTSAGQNTEIISNNGQPFQLTALRSDVSSYRQVFALQSNYSATQLSPPEIAHDYPDKPQNTSC